jgi:uncharacterized membrane protein
MQIFYMPIPILICVVHKIKGVHKMRTLQHFCLTAAIIAMLTACGDSKGDRALSGGAIGAGVGAVSGAVVGGSPVTGALIGGAAGAATGGLTDKKDINLGKPVWR